MLNKVHLSRADLNLLVLFEAVLDERHVGRAAERLNLTPSAVSHGLGRLRQLLNDPLFLRTPKGVVPTARATELAEPIADILARVRRVVSIAEPFDPSASTRRFTIGSPDGASAVVLPPLLNALQQLGPGIDISTKQMLPAAGATTPMQAWQHALADIEANALDIAILPMQQAPPRFVVQPLYEEEFVIACRRGHPYARQPTMDRFCRARHLLVSMTGDAHGFVDDMLAKRGRARRVALTLPNFMMALAFIAESDLIGALPKRFVTAHAARFGVVAAKAPLPLRSDDLCAIASKSAMNDAGVAWLFRVLKDTHNVKSAGKRSPT
jgi:DNA-binding transcriptional LysR family regulator